MLLRSTSIKLCDQAHRFGVVLDTFISKNSQFCQDVSNRMVGIESQLNELTASLTGSPKADAPTLKYAQTCTQEQRFELKTEASRKQKLGVRHSPGRAPSASTVQVHVQRRLLCDSNCFCACHQTQRLATPSFAKNIVGNLFLGYSGFPTLFRKCNILGCRQESSKNARMTYRFPWWFWQRAVNLCFTWNSPDGPELLLRFPFIRPSDCDWFGFARMGDVEGMQCLLERGQASRIFFRLQTALPETR